MYDHAGRQCFTNVSEATGDLRLPFLGKLELEDFACLWIAYCRVGSLIDMQSGKLCRHRVVKTVVI